MKFKCNEVSIDEKELGCAVSFSENEDSYDYEKEQSIDEILSSIGHYIMLQRTYPEDEFEKDYYYFESCEPDKSGELKDFAIDLYRKQFVMALDNELYEIHFNIDDPTYQKLKVVLSLITNGQGQINFYD